MISVYKIKPWFQRTLHPILLFLNRNKVTANQITISAFFFSFLIGVLFWFADQNPLFYLALPIGLLLRMALNALDGMMARQFNQISKKGELYNELGDVVSDLFVFFPLIKFQPEAIFPVVLFIALSPVNEFAGIMGKVISDERRYEGPMGKSDRALLLGIYGILCYTGVNLSTYSSWIFSILCTLLILSTIVRVTKTLKAL